VRAAFSLLELLAAVAIVVLLAAVLIPNLRPYMKRAGEAACAANMRSINVALRGYLQDHKEVWPQGPGVEQGKPWEDFWLATLKPYGISAQTWTCRTIISSLADGGAKKEDMPRIHYIPTMFSAEAGIANRWATQPWLLERANAHGNGPLICFPDGSVKAFNKVLAEQGVR
jgi:type II secretory pathway pseudopilin PulG